MVDLYSPLSQRPGEKQSPSARIAAVALSEYQQQQDSSPSSLGSVAHGSVPSTETLKTIEIDLFEVDLASI